MKLESLVLWDEIELFTECGKAEEGYMGCAKYVFSDTGICLQASSLTHFNFSEQDELERLFLILQTEDAHCILRGQVNMTAFCNDRLHDHVPYSFNRECWGFRVIGEHIAWYLACTPWNQRCHFTLYAYNRETLFSLMAGKRDLPLWCYGVYKFTGERIRMFFAQREFERYPQYGGNFNANDLYAREENENIEVSAAQRAAMENGVIYGWETPVARVENYDTEGRYCPEEKEVKGKR